MLVALYEIRKGEYGAARNRLEKIRMGGGEKRIKKQHDQGKLTARERIQYLTDEDSHFFEIGAFAGYEMHEEYGGCPAGGVVMGIGTALTEAYRIEEGVPLTIEWMRSVYDEVGERR